MIAVLFDRTCSQPCLALCWGSHCELELSAERYHLHLAPSVGWDVGEGQALCSGESLCSIIPI